MTYDGIYNSGFKIINTTIVKSDIKIFHSAKMTGQYIDLCDLDLNFS